MGRGKEGMVIKADFTNVLPVGCKSIYLHLFIQSNLILPCYDYPFFTPFTSIRLKRVLYKIVFTFFFKEVSPMNKISTLVLGIIKAIWGFEEYIKYSKDQLQW